MKNNNDITKLSDNLMRLCQEYGVFQAPPGTLDVHDDLLDSGCIDSMGVVYLQGIIQEQFSLELSLDLFIAELRSIRSIAEYLAERISADTIEKTPIFDTDDITRLNN